MYNSVHVNIFSQQSSFHYCVSIATFTMHFMFFKPVSSGGMFWNFCARIICFLLLVAARKVNRGPLGVLKVHTGKIDNCWKQAKSFLPSNMLTKKGKNKDVMLWLRCWQWRYENKTATLFTMTASTLRAH